uniref:Uncharacterized protein n=1 Tax=Denticeps clupeoides TaxID=299321 RepID=A0AAY4B9V5_9TELE
MSYGLCDSLMVCHEKASPDRELKSTAAVNPDRASKGYVLGAPEVPSVEVAVATTGLLPCCILPLEDPVPRAGSPAWSGVAAPVPRAGSRRGKAWRPWSLGLAPQRGPAWWPRTLGLAPWCGPALRPRTLGLAPRRGPAWRPRTLVPAHNNQGRSIWVRVGPVSTRPL